MKRTYYFIFSAILPAIAVIVASCSHKSTTDDSALPAIDVADVVTDSVVLYKEYPGTLNAVNVVELVARVNGYLLKQNYADGASVAKGQVLFTIEPTQYQDAVNQAQAQLATAKSQHEYYTQQYEAMKKALQSDAVSQMEVNQAKSNLETSAASIKNAQAALQTAQTNLAYCTVRAPIAGTVTASTMSAGSYVAGAASPVVLATLYDNSRVRADFYIEDASFLRMFINNNNRQLIDYDSIPINFNEKLPHSYAAKLQYMAPDVNTSTGTLQLRAEMENPYGELRDGMFVTVSLPYKVEPKAMLVKDASISTDQLGKFIYVVNDSNKVVYTPIQVGDLVDDTMRVVTSGINPTDRYVTKALLKVRAGMEIKPVETK